jgi:uncharacterized membrane protein YfcA
MDWILCLIAGALAGSLVSMTGSGAGFLLVPGLSLALSFSAFPNADLFKIAVLPLFLKEYLPAHKVVGTTVAGCLIMSIPAAATYYAFSPPPVRCGSDCLGPIFLPGMFAASIAASLAAPLGAWLSHALPPVIRRRAFSALLLLVVANMLVKRGSLIAPASLSASELVGVVEERPVESGTPPVCIGEPAQGIHDAR